jgi:hypothetical protein
VSTPDQPAPARRRREAKPDIGLVVLSLAASWATLAIGVHLVFSADLSDFVHGCLFAVVSVIFALFGARLLYRSVGYGLLKAALVVPGLVTLSGLTDATAQWWVANHGHADLADPILLGSLVLLGGFWVVWLACVPTAWYMLVHRPSH